MDPLSDHSPEVDPFIDYPPEAIQKICEKLDNVSLAKAMEASSSIYQACVDMLDRRKLLHENIDLLSHHSEMRWSKYFDTKYGGIISKVIVMSVGIQDLLTGKINNTLNVSQFFEPADAPLDPNERIRYIILKWKQPKDLRNIIPPVVP